MRTTKLPPRFSRSFTGSTVSACRMAADADERQVRPLGYRPVGESWVVGPDHTLTITYERPENAVVAIAPRTQPPLMFLFLAIAVLLIVGAATFSIVAQPFTADAHRSPDPTPTATAHRPTPPPTVRPTR
jgi:hypothetical protein